MRRLEPRMGLREFEAGPIKVALGSCQGYEPDRLAQTTDELLRAAGDFRFNGLKVLVKPNLLRAGNNGLACTHPRVTGAVCRYLKDAGARVRVGDSPGFGSARRVARRIGLVDELKGLGVEVVNLDGAVRVRLPFGHSLGVSRQALENDLIFNLPKLKVHNQMRMTGAVKNLFGCVVGVRKAVAHTKHGDVSNRFESMLVELQGVLPQSMAMIDGIRAMHVKGPSGGEPYSLNLMGASLSNQALDTSIYMILNLRPDEIPLWREARARGYPGARPEDLAFPLRRPDEFDSRGFMIPKTLDPATFHPLRLAKSAVKRAWARIV